MAFQGQPAQNFVPISEIQNGVVVLKNGGLRSILMASSINFALQSQDEQQAVIAQFQNFLNVLEFSVQIYTQSREFDIEPYLATLEERERAQTSDLMKIQTREYIEFVREFVNNTNIMTKTFYLVVPYDPAPDVGGSTNWITDKLGVSSGQKTSEKKVENTREHRSQLEQRVGIVEQGISRTGVRTAQLGTEEVIELFYKIFNPDQQSAPTQYLNNES